MKKKYRKRFYRLEFTTTINVEEYPNQIAKLHDKILRAITAEAGFWADPKDNAWVKDCKTGRFKGSVRPRR